MAAASSPLRSLWRVRPTALLRAGTVRADAVILDLTADPAPAPGSLAFALAAARRLARAQVWLRVSPIGAGRLDTELDAVLPGRPDALVLPCGDGAGLQQAGVKLGVREAEQGWTAGAVGLIAAPDAAGLLRLGSFLGASDRLEGVLLEDLSPDAGGPPLASFARGLVLLMARAAGIPAFDGLPGNPAAPPGGFAGRVTEEPAALAAIEAALAL